jgi:hypothetical protein
MADPPYVSDDLRPTPGDPRERTMPAGKVLVLMVVGLAVAGLLNADVISRKSNAQHADSWRADVASFIATVSGPLTWPRDRIDTALGRGTSDADIDELLAQQQEPAPSGEASGPVTTTTIGPPEVRAPTPADPLRVYVGGDSMASEFSKSFEAVAASTGVMTTTLDPRVSTGLTRPDYFNWPDHLVNDVLASDVETLVLMFGANDAQGLEMPDGTVYERFSEPWREEYRRRVAGTMDLLKSDTRMTFWVGMPIMDPSAGVAGQDMLNHIYWSEAKSRPWITFVDSWPYFADSNGNYSQQLPSADGTTRGLRQGDGVHWSKWGADRIAWEVLEVMEEQIDLTAGTVSYPPDQVAPPEVEPRDDIPMPASP